MNQHLGEANHIKKVLLITNNLEHSPNGGREMLCMLNYQSLSELYSDNLIVQQLTKSKNKGLFGLLAAFLGYIDGVNKQTISEAVEKIKADTVDTVFVDGSNLGEISRCIKKQFPAINIITYFHNVESVFFWGAFKQNKKSKSLLVALVNYFAERKSVRYSNRLIALSERDSNMLERIYGRRATDISAIALKDSYPENQGEKAEFANGKYALFVGGTFYANVSGIFWYAKNVAPFVKIETWVVGKGFEQYKEALEGYGNMRVVGTVDDVASYYHGAEFVVAPIFGGSGMKTKVAEALMHGKEIIGTTEAFSGYDDIAEVAGYMCETAEEFIKSIAHTLESNKTVFDTDMRQLYLKQYSCSALKNRLHAILRVSV